MIEDLLAANRVYARTRAAPSDARPGRRLAVLTCMDARIDVRAALGLNLGEAHVLRNAGARVTEDVLRSLALSTHILGVDTVIVMEHTRCGLAGTSDEDLRARTGADLPFLSIAEHSVAIQADVDRLTATPFLGPVRNIAGLIYDVDTGLISEVTRWQRPS